MDCQRLAFGSLLKLNALLDLWHSWSSRVEVSNTCLEVLLLAYKSCQSLFWHHNGLISKLGSFSRLLNNLKSVKKKKVLWTFLVEFVERMQTQTSDRKRWYSELSLYGSLVAGSEDPWTIRHKNILLEIIASKSASLIRLYPVPVSLLSSNAECRAVFDWASGSSVIPNVS